MISNFRRVLNIVCILILYIQPLKMELIEGSETSANNNRTPGKYPKEYIQSSIYIYTSSLSALKDHFSRHKE